MRPQEGDEVVPGMCWEKARLFFKDEIIDEINIFSTKLYVILYDSSVVFKLSKHLNRRFLLL